MTKKKERALKIIGQGIAGTSLAWQCIFRSIPFTIIDDGHRTSSSLAAAGLFNPLILKRRKLAWRAHDLMPSIRPFYRRVERALRTTIYHESGVWRRIADVREANDWTSLKEHESFAHYLGRMAKAEEVSRELDAPHGFQQISGAGHVDVASYLIRSRGYFKERGYVETARYPQVDTIKEGTSLLRFIATGYMGAEDDPSVAFNPAKGHTMLIHCEGLDIDAPVSGPCFIIPVGDSRYKVGSTYSWKNFNNQVEKEEIEKLRANFEQICGLSYEILECWAGVRPVSKDRRPVIGADPKDVDRVIFNGFGSRAIMTTPLLSAMAIDHVFESAEIWPEVVLERFTG